jgi:hypothetical protein
MLKMIITFHNQKQRGRDREEETGGSVGGKDTEGKIQRGRDKGEDIKGKRQREK